MVTALRLGVSQQQGRRVLQLSKDIVKLNNFAKSVNFVLTNTKKSLKSG